MPTSTCTLLYMYLYVSNVTCETIMALAESKLGRDPYKSTWQMAKPALTYLSQCISYFMNPATFRCSSFFCCLLLTQNSHKIRIIRIDEEFFHGLFHILPAFLIHLHVLYYPWFNQDTSTLLELQ